MTQKKTQKKSLKEFIDGAPGAALPVQALLPTKPGQGPSRLDYGVADKFQRISLSNADNHGSHKHSNGSSKPFSVTGTSTAGAAGGGHWTSGLAGRNELPHHPPPPPPPPHARTRYGSHPADLPPPPPPRPIAGDYAPMYGGRAAGYPYDAYEQHGFMPMHAAPPPPPHFAEWDTHRQWDARRDFEGHSMLDFHDLPPPPPPSMAPGVAKPAYNRNAPPPVAPNSYDWASPLPYPAYAPPPYSNGSYPRGPAVVEHEYVPAPGTNTRDYPVMVEHSPPCAEPLPRYMEPAPQPAFVAPPEPAPVKLLQRCQQQQPHSALVEAMPRADNAAADHKTFSPSSVKQQDVSAVVPPAHSPPVRSPRSPKTTQHANAPVPAAEPLTATASGTAVSTEVPLLADIDPQPVSAVRNEFAERLAQQALSRLANKLSTTSGKLSTATSSVKSDLLHEAVATHRERSTSPTTTASVAGDGSNAGDFAVPVERSRLVASPRSHLGDATMPSHGSLAASSVMLTVPSSKASSDEGSEEQRPRLKLQPRSVPVDSKPSAQMQDVDTRRKLQLQPRASKDTAANADNGRPTVPASAGSKSSIFGQARPREEVLRERGVDVVDTDLLVTRNSGANPSAHHGYGSNVKASRAGSVTSLYSGDTPQMDQGGAAQWQTVGKPRAKGGYREDAGVSLGHDDVLLGAFNSRPAYRHDGYQYDAPGRNYHGGGFGGRHTSHGREENEADGSGFVFKRALPIRSDDI